MAVDFPKAYGSRFRQEIQQKSQKYTLYLFIRIIDPINQSKYLPLDV